MANSNYCVPGPGLGTGIEHEHGDVPVLRVGEEATAKCYGHRSHVCTQTGIRKLITGQQGSLGDRESENNDSGGLSRALGRGKQLSWSLVT